MSSTYTASTQSGSVSPLTTKGDIYTYDTADARLPVGTNGQVLTANSAEATGLEWISLGLGTMSTQNANAVAITGGTLSGITQLDVDNIRIDGNTISSTDANGNINLTPNGSGVIAGTQLTLTTALDETYGGTAQTTYTTGDILYASGANTLSKLPISSNENALLTTVGGIPSWQQTYGANVFEIYDDFWHSLDGDWTTPSSGAGSVSSFNEPAEVGHPGLWGGSTGSTTTGYALIHGYIDCMRATDGELIFTWIARVPSTLSNGTETYTQRVGILDSITGTLGNDGIFFSYTDSENAGNWTCYTMNGGASTTTDSGVTVSTSTWYNFTVTLNSAGNSCAFYIDGSLVATHTTNITSNPVTPVCVIVKSAGTTFRSTWADMFKLRQILNTPR